MSSSVFKIYSSYYDLLYKDKDYFAEAEYIRNILGRYGIYNGELLEFGSGTGQHGCHLAEMGYRVHGIELSNEMVQRAKKTKGFSCQQGNICNINMGKQYDAVLSLFHVISYQITDEEIKNVFTRAAEHLRPGGVFVFDFWYSPAVYTQKPSVRIKRIDDDDVEITRIAEPFSFPNENRVDVKFTIYVRLKQDNTIKVMSEKHAMRHYSLSEINIIGKITGFELVESEEFMTGKNPSEETWGVCVVLKRV